jgi:hypothetical protein
MSGNSYFACPDICYHNVRALPTKCTNFYDSVCAYDYKIIFIRETRFNDSIPHLNLLPHTHSVFQADRGFRVCNLSGGGDAFIAVKIIQLSVSNVDGIFAETN